MTLLTTGIYKYFPCIYMYYAFTMLCAAGSLKKQHLELLCWSTCATFHASVPEPELKMCLLTLLYPWPVFTNYVIK